MSQHNDKLQDLEKQLDAIIVWFNSEDFSVDEALQKYQDASEIVKKIDSILDTHKNNISVLKKKFD